MSGKSFHKLAMPDDNLVERGMSAEAKAEHQRKLARWRKEREDREGGKET